MASRGCGKDESSEPHDQFCVPIAMTQQTLTLAFVGYGSIAAAHARALRELGGVRFDSVVGRRPEATEQFARDWGFGHWTLSLAEALARPGLDAVIICSPSEQHAGQSEQALAAGKHVLVEIPLAMNQPDAERVTMLAERTGLCLMVAHTQRFFPALLELRRRIAVGDLHPHHLVCKWFFLRRSNVNWEGRQRSWTDNLLWHHACHVVDAALWLLGQTAPGATAAVRANGQTGPPLPELSIPLDLDLLLTVGDVPVNIAMSYNSSWPMHDYLVIGEEATVRFENGHLYTQEGELFTPVDAHPIREQDREFLSAVREGREPGVSGRSVLPAMRALQVVQDQIDRSSQPAAPAPTVTTALSGAATESEASP
jgi:2-hydroxy-4-carboxymuconate semialdehyde hemiacetal dehydrogenase